MSDLPASVESLSAKIDRLVALHRESSESNRSLRSENQDLVRLLEEEKKKVESLTERNKVLAMARSVHAEGKNSLELKLKINELVRELDKCIAMLNR